MCISYKPQLSDLGDIPTSDEKYLPSRGAGSDTGVAPVTKAGFLVPEFGVLDSPEMTWEIARQEASVTNQFKL